MEKKNCIYDPKFRRNCLENGICPDYVEIIGNNIVVKTASDVYIIFDDNYNIIDINNNGLSNINESSKLNYPFQNYQLGQINELSKKVDIRSSNHGHSIDYIIDGCIFYEKENRKLLELVSYIKFLDNQIKEYNHIKFHMRSVDIQLPDIYTYLNNLMNKINKYIDECVQKDTRPQAEEILEVIGQIPKYDYTSIVLYQIGDLLLNDKLQQDSNNNDLSQHADKFLNTLKDDTNKNLEHPELGKILKK